MDELQHAAAVLAAAIINSAGVRSPEAAAIRYFDCLNALHEERKNRNVRGAPTEGGGSGPGVS